MKNFLIGLNLVLAALLLWNLPGLLKKPVRAPAAKTAPAAKKSEFPKRQKASQPAASAPERKLSPEERIDFIVKNSIFDFERTPNAVPGRSTRTEMTLVGTFLVGKLQGAVILQKNASNNRNGMFPPPGMMGPGRQQGFSGMNSNTNTSPRSRRSGTSRSSGSSASNSGGTMPGGMPGGPIPGFMAQNQDPNGQTSASNTGIRQYIRVGETLVNGYTLVEVTRTSATLTRGNDKTELQLTEASKNMASGSQSSGRQNVGQQMLNQIMQGFQNLQRQQGFQNMQMMRMIQEQNGGGQGGGQQGPARRTGTR